MFVEVFGSKSVQGRWSLKDWVFRLPRKQRRGGCRDMVQAQSPEGIETGLGRWSYARLSVGNRQAGISSAALAYSRVRSKALGMDLVSEVLTCPACTIRQRQCKGPASCHRDPGQGTCLEGTVMPAFLLQYYHVVDRSHHQQETMIPKTPERPNLRKQAKHHPIETTMHLM